MNKFVVVILFIFNVLACNPIQQASQKKNLAPAIPFACLSSQSLCEVSTELGIFTIQFSGQTDSGKLKTELPFEIQLAYDALTANAQLKSINSFLEGKTMFMGKVPVFFQIAENKNAPIIAQTLLASCSEEIMTWRLWLNVDVIVEGKVKQQDFFIDFDSKRL